MSRNDKLILLLVGLGFLLLAICCSGIGEETGLF